MWLINKLLANKKKFSKDKYEKAFIKHNKHVWKEKKRNDQNLILVELNSMQPSILMWSYLSNVLADKYDANIYTFSEKALIPDKRLLDIYKSFGSNGDIAEVLNDEQRKEKEKILNSIWGKIKNLNDILSIRLKNISLGIDIYTTYLRAGNPTVELDSYLLKKYIDLGITKTLYWDNFIQCHNVKAVIVSHPCYLKSNVIAKIARKYNTPVYLAWGMSAIYKIESDFIQGEKFEQYKTTMFRNLPIEEQKVGIEWAKQQLDKRFSGTIGVDMSYSLKSSFGKADYNNIVLEKNNKIKILICTHCFFDNPHCYGWMIFPDFYQWLSHLGEISEKTDYDWYLKVHPDYRPGTIETVQRILAKYPKIKMISSEISHHQLVYEGIDVVLTVYGTVGCEYPLLGVNVINAGKNPHVAYDFNYHPRNLQEYDNLLFNLQNLPPIKKDVIEKEVYEFYYIHHQYGKRPSIKKIKDDMIFESEERVKENLGGYNNLFKNKLYQCFLNEFTDERHLEIINNVKLQS
ncbi:hypothetical protein [Sporomusa sphaeroides]|uniref:hypothetical protein n=1 Tax=Sporomusa sphaeroides TaxID=47679 RepID=UPI00315860DF